jgi:hypothetical protein
MNWEVAATFSKMAVSPDPISYLRVIEQAGILEQDDLKEVMLRYISWHNQQRSFYDNTNYTLEPFKELPLNDLVAFVHLLRKAHLLKD